MPTYIQEDYVRCVWPNVALPLGKKGDFLVKRFKEKYGINIEYLEETTTLPHRSAEGRRVDQIFNVQGDSIEKFEQIKSEIGAYYVKEIVRNKQHYIYIERVYLRYFKRSEDELIREGELSKEDAYNTL
ncbi:hypothetical protein GCM10028778_21990 [Barrientosiimonas marina]|uniref:Uncharacterized protein n=1 Tax=Lentibacillus kimchii TaxID=1542911 RepID=A0ABW2URT1_9BACI